MANVKKGSLRDLLGLGRLMEPPHDVCGFGAELHFLCFFTGLLL